MEVLQQVREKKAAGKAYEQVVQAVKEFQVRFGRLPAHLNELVERGLLERVPDAPDEQVFVLDPLTGNVQLVRKAEYELRTRAGRSAQ